MLPFYEILDYADVSILKYHGEVVFPDHLHKYIEITYVSSGIQRITIDNTDYTLNAGEASVVFPNIVHGYHPDDPRPSDVTMLIFNPAVFGSVFSDINKLKAKNPVIPAENIDGDVRYAFEHMDGKMEIKKQAGWALLVFSYLLEQLEISDYQADPTYGIIPDIIQYIDKNFTTPITRKMIAKQFNVTENCISNIFNRVLKMDLRNYLGVKRAECAAKLIRTTDDPMTVICEKAGFESISTFNRVFHANYGLSPRQYRSNIHKLMK